jgi:hypothetical protein
MLLQLFNWLLRLAAWMRELRGTALLVSTDAPASASAAPADAPASASAPSEAPTTPLNSHAGAPAEATICAICWSAGEDERVEMPCCGTRTSTTWYCRRCIEIICENGGGIGMCPIGCGFIRIDDGVVSRSEPPRAMCRLCMQTRAIASGGMCAACLLGSRLALRYECDRCHGTQRIPHPMWRYQRDGPGEFGDVTWACHVGCGDYTHWRVVPEDIRLVPPIDAPPSWGQQLAWVAQVREQRQNELRAAGRGEAPYER